MLHLPPGQGFSIYSLAAVLPLLAAKQRATDPNDWMSTDAEVACPDPNCPTRLRITRTGQAPLQPWRGDGGAAAGDATDHDQVERSAFGPATRSRGSSAAAGNLPAAMAPVDRAGAVDDLAAFCEAGITTFDCADIYTGVEELIGEFRAGYAGAHGARGARAAARSTPNSCPISTRLPRCRPHLCARVIDTSLRASGRSGSISCSSIGGTMPFRAMSKRRAGSTSCTARARSTLSAAPISIRRARRAARRRRAARLACRCSIRCSKRGRSTAWSTLCRRNRRPSALLRHGGRRLSLRPLARRAGAAAALREPLAHQVQADHRRFRRLGPVPGIARRAAPDRRPPWHRYRHGRQPRDARPGRSRRSSSAPATAGISPPMWRDRAAAHGRRSRRDRRGAGATPGTGGDTFALERDRTGRHGSIMKYNLNKGA